MTTSSRTLTAAVLLSLGAYAVLIGPASPATAAADPAATVSEVTCADEDGTLTVTLEAGDSPQTFVVLVDGSSLGDDPETPVAAGATETVEVTGLEDGDHSVEVLLENGEDDATTITEETRSVVCDVAPEGPYTNIKGSVFDDCEGSGTVIASNEPIAGAVENLQPATFEVVFTPTEDEVGGGDNPVGEDPVDGVEDPPTGGERIAADGETVLDTFVLDAQTQTYDRTFGPDELGGTGELTLRSGGETVATGIVYLCIVLPTEAGAGESGGGPAVPDTGF